MRDYLFSWHTKVYIGDSVCHNGIILGHVTSIKVICSCRFVITMISDDSQEEEVNKMIEVYGEDYKKHLSISKTI